MAGDAMVKLVQNSLNQVLSSIGCRGIGVDGKMGPETCGAMDYVLAKAGSLPVSSALQIVQSNTNLMDSCTSASYSCAKPSTSATPVSTSTTPTVPAATTSRISSANLVMISATVLAVGVVGYAVAKKKGWIQ